MKKTFTSSRLYAAALSSMLGLSAFGADCVVNYTNFDTYNQLCNPDLTDDLEGWYNDSIRNGACKGPKETTIDSVKQGGMLRAKIQTSGNITFEEYVDLYSGSVASHGRYTDVVAEPRTLSPYFMETESKNMIVTAGSVSDDFVFMTYKVENLVPGSNVTLTFDAYNLLSSEKMENYLIELSQNSKEPVTRLEFGGLTFNMQTKGYTLVKGTGMIMENRASLSVSTDMSQGVVPSGDRISTSSNFDYGTKVNLTLSSKADANGEICFYFSTQAGSYSPIGIDNIKIEGEAQPKIKCSKRLPVCNGSAVSFDIPSILDNEDITYSWSNGKEVATTKEFTPSLDEADKLYTVKCTIKSTECSATSSIEVPTKLCCMTADGKPLGIIDVFFDDFGEFSADGTEYTYISNGKKITVPTTGIYGAGDPKRCVNALQEGASVPYITPCSKNSGLSDAWAISNVNPYNPGVLSDASGDPMGGMLIVDLSGDKVNGTPLKDLVIYRHVASGNLKGKEITAGCNLGTINYAAERDQAILKVIIRNETDTIFSQEVNLKGDEGWLNIEHNFVSPSDSLTFEIRNETYTYVTSQGDIAIDNVFMSYCDEPKAPSLPSIKIGYNTNAKSIVNLCKDDDLEFNVKISESAESNFEDLQYMLQYSRDYINWNTISRIQSDKSFVVDEGINPCFDDTLIGKIVYFRIVAADYASLIGFDSGNLSSDKVSISDFAIVASDPKCDYSDTIPSDITPEVSECMTPEGNYIPSVTLFYDDFGEFSADGTKYTYKNSDGKKVEENCGISIYGNPYTHTLQDGVTVGEKAVTAIYECGWMISNYNQYKVGIDSDCSENPNGGMLIMDLAGTNYANKAIYSHKTKGNIKDKNVRFECSVGAINFLENTPVIRLKAIVRADNDTLVSSDVVSLYGTEGWQKIDLSFISNSDSLIAEIIVIDDNLTGVNRGDFAIDNVLMKYCDTENTSTPSIADRTNVFDASDVVRSEYFNFVGQKVNGNVKGLVIERILLKNGNIITRKIMRE